MPVRLTPWRGHRHELPEHLVTTGGAARILGASVWVPCHAVRRGKLVPAYREQDGCAILLRADVEALAAERAARAAARPSPADDRPPYGGRGVRAADAGELLGLSSSVIRRRIRAGAIRAELWRGAWHCDPASLRAAGWGRRGGPEAPCLGPTLMTMREAAERLRLQRSGVLALVYRGHLTGFQIGRFWYALRADVERLHRDGWPQRQWGKVLGPYEFRFRRAERNNANQRRLRARLKAVREEAAS